MKFKIIFVGLILSAFAVITVLAINTTIHKGNPPGSYYGELLFKDGKKADYTWIGQGGKIGTNDGDDFIFYSKTIENEDAPTQWISFSDISKIEFLDLTKEEEQAWKNASSSQFRFLKAKITFKDDVIWDYIYLYPTGWYYKTRYYEGAIYSYYSDTINKNIKAITFNLRDLKTCPACSREYAEQDWKFCPYDGTALEPKK